MKNKTTYDRAMHDKTHPYTLISAELINNEDLSGEERFLMMYLLGRSDDYIFNSSYFANNAQQLFGWGRDKFYKIWMNLQKKGYISKEKIRANGMIDGEHYTIHEILPQFLKNQNTENSESGESEIRQTSALPIIDKPNIDKPIIDIPTSTNTNHKDGAILYEGKHVKSLEESMDEEINELFELIKEKNSSDITNKWRLTKKDKELLRDAVDMYGLGDAKRIAEEIISKSTIEYQSVSYIFSDLKYDAHFNNDDEEFTEESLFDVMSSMDDKNMFTYIKDVVSNYHLEARFWKPSAQDVDICTLLTDYGSKIDLVEKLTHGLDSAKKKNKWSFQQITYQAIAALNNYDENYTL